MADRILSREAVISSLNDLRLRHSRLAHALDVTDAALRAQVAGLEAWAAKVPHGSTCNRVVFKRYIADLDGLVTCDNCRDGIHDGAKCIWCDGSGRVKPSILPRGASTECNCHLSTLPADLIARGQEIAKKRKTL